MEFRALSSQFRVNGFEPAISPKPWNHAGGKIGHGPALEPCLIGDRSLVSLVPALRKKQIRPPEFAAHAGTR